MRLWQVFSPEDQEYIDLMEKGIIFYNKNYKSFIEENDIDLAPVYTWLASQFKVPGKYKFPFHLFYQVEGSSNPMDNKYFAIHCSGLYKIIIFDIDDKKVKLYDDDLFVICLNHGYLSLSEQEDNEFENYIKCFPKLGINTYELFDEQYVNSLNEMQKRFAKEYLSRIYKSWKHIFNIHLPVNNWSVGKYKTIMGMTWTLHKNQINNIIDFYVTEEEIKRYYQFD